VLLTLSIRLLVGKLESLIVADGVIEPPFPAIQKLHFSRRSGGLNSEMTSSECQAVAIATPDDSYGPRHNTNV
jgi:hypothetical protein